MTDGNRQGYGKLFHRAANHETARLAAIAEVFDPFTRERISALPIKSARRILEIGPGASTIATWLADAYHADELVLVDQDARLLEWLATPAIRVVTSDVDDGGLDVGTFDLIHARFVLTHLPAPQHTLSRLVSWLRPGGWLIVGDAVYRPAACTDPVVTNVLNAFTQTVQRAVGTNTLWPGTFPEPLRQSGLIGTGAATDSPPLTGAGPLATALCLTLRSLRSPLLTSGTVTAHELDTALTYLGCPSLTTTPPMSLATAWGRRLSG